MAHNWIHLLIYPVYNKMFKAELNSLRVSLLDFICRRRRASVSDITITYRRPIVATGDGGVQLRSNRRKQTVPQVHPNNVPELMPSIRLGGETQRSNQDVERSEVSRHSGFGRFSLVMPSEMDHVSIWRVKETEVTVSQIGGEEEIGFESLSAGLHKSKRRWSTGTRSWLGARRLSAKSKTGKTAATQNPDSGLGKSDSVGPNEIITKKEARADNVDERL